jgi:hypothetical protein
VSLTKSIFCTLANFFSMSTLFFFSLAFQGCTFGRRICFCILALKVGSNTSKNIVNSYLYTFDQEFHILYLNGAVWLILSVLYMLIVSCCYLRMAWTLTMLQMLATESCSLKC